MERISVSENAIFWLQNEAIIFCKLTNLDSSLKLDYKTAQSYIDAIVLLTKGSPMPLVVDLRYMKGTFTISAAQLLSKTFASTSLITCEAYVVNSLSIKLLVHSYKRLFGNDIPYTITHNMLLAREFCVNKSIIQ